MSNKDKNKQGASEKEVNKDEQKPQEKEQHKNEDEKDPHRGTADTPPQAKEMMPGSQDPDSGYIDEDGALDEELEDLEDEKE
ncbi:MAG: hypothetical protein WC756_20070 [Taibaiella sp.]|jgi:hypothetical protein